MATLDSFATVEGDYAVQPLLTGVFVSTALFGVTCAQVFYYFRNYALDDILIKGTVITLLILESFHLALGVVAIYSYLNGTDLEHGPWSMIMSLGLSSTIILVVNIFYVRRVHFMSKNIPLLAILTVLVLAHFATGIAATVQVFKLSSFSALKQVDIHEYRGWAFPLAILQTLLCLSVAIDLIIAGSLSFYLHTGRSGIESTNTLINKLMAHTINNGILTSVFDIMVLIFVTIAPSNMIFLSIFQVVGNLYTNSMLATLNSRQYLARTCHPDSQCQGAKSNIAFSVQRPPTSRDNQAHERGLMP